MLKEAVNIDKIGQEIADYLSAYIRIDKIIVYGSYAYGEPREDSDIDIAVVSDNFREMSILEKIELLSKVSLAIDSRIEVKGFTRREYDHASAGSLVSLIRQKGKEITHIPI